MQMNVGFIGLGSMGWPMAVRLVQAGHRLTVMDSDAARTLAFAQEYGAASSSTGAELGRNVDFVITMLPTSAIVEAVLAGNDGALSTLKKGSLVIDMSSGVPTATQSIEKKVISAGCRLIDAPVSGGVPRARTGELTIMVGGSMEDVERARSLLNSLGTAVVATGKLGSAHAVKALNNLVSAAGFAIGVEAMLIGQRFGVDPSLFVDVLNSSTGMSNSSQKKFKQFVLSRTFNSGFGLDLMLKDISIALDLAASTETKVPLAEECFHLWTQAQSQLGKGPDHTELARYCELTVGDFLKGPVTGTETSAAT